MIGTDDDYNENNILDVLKNSMSNVAEDDSLFLKEHIKYCNKYHNYHRKFHHVKILDSKIITLNSLKDFNVKFYDVTKNLLIKFNDSDDVYSFGSYHAICLVKGGKAASFGIGDAISKDGPAEAFGDGHAFAYGFYYAVTHGLGDAVSVIMCHPKYVTIPKHENEKLHICEAFGDGSATLIDRCGYTGEHEFDDDDDDDKIPDVEVLTHHDGDVNIYTKPLTSNDVFDNSSNRIKGYRGFVSGTAYGHGRVRNHSNGVTRTFGNGYGLGFGKDFAFVQTEGSGNAIGVRCFKVMANGGGDAINLSINDSDGAIAYVTGNAFVVGGIAEAFGTGIAVGIFNGSGAITYTDGDAILLSYDLKDLDAFLNLRIDPKNLTVLAETKLEKESNLMNNGIVVTLSKGNAFHFGGGHAECKGTGSSYSACHIEGKTLKIGKMIVNGPGNILRAAPSETYVLNGTGRILDLEKPLKTPFLEIGDHGLYLRRIAKIHPMKSTF